MVLLLLFVQGVIEQREEQTEGQTSSHARLGMLRNLIILST